MKIFRFPLFTPVHGCSRHSVESASPLTDQTAVRLASTTNFDLQPVLISTLHALMLRVFLLVLTLFLTFPFCSARRCL